MIFQNGFAVPCRTICDRPIQGVHFTSGSGAEKPKTNDKKLAHNNKVALTKR